jgi:uncharacterized protein YjbJ (UPF0337 family)
MIFSFIGKDKLEEMAKDMVEDKIDDVKESVQNKVEEVKDNFEGEIKTKLVDVTKEFGISLGGDEDEKGDDSNS